MQPDGQVEPGHALEQCQVLRAIERLAVDVREDLDAARAEIADGALGFAHRGVGVAERQRRHEAREPVRMRPNQFRHAVVGGAGQVDAVLSGGKDFDRRRRDRQDLLILLEPIHHAEALVEIDQHRDVAHPLADVLERRRHAHHQLEIRSWVDVIEDVDLSHGLIIAACGDTSIVGRSDWRCRGGCCCSSACGSPASIRPAGLSRRRISYTSPE
jgi:hypothetical protein